MYIQQTEWEALTERIAKAEQSLTDGVGMYSLVELQRKLESTWKPSADILLGIRSVGIPSLATVPHARVSLSNSQTISDSALTAISWDNEQWDTDSMFDISSPTKITFPVAGLYGVTGGVRYDPSATGVRIARIRLNGSTVIADDARSTAGSAVRTSCVPSTQWRFAVGDYIELLTYQTSGGNLDVFAGSEVHLSAAYISGTA